MRTIAILLTTLFFLGTNLTAQEKDLADLLYEAIYAEEITGELNEAKAIYEGILKTYPDKRQECAQAVYHLGLIAEKAGKHESKKAGSYYTELINNYQEIGEYASLARNRMRIIEDKNTFIDPRDGHKYKYVQIGNQTWMAENLAYMPWVNPPKKQEYGIWVYDYDGLDVAEAKATENYQKYGCLYDWTTAMDIDPKFLSEKWDGSIQDHQGFCPPGWHIPSDQDYMNLEVKAGYPEENVANVDPYSFSERMESESEGIGSILKSSQGWLSGGNGTDSLGFNILPGGTRSKGTNNIFSFQGLGKNTRFWTSTVHQDAYEGCPTDQSFIRSLSNLNPSNDIDNKVHKSIGLRNFGYSIRCVKNSTLKIRTFPTVVHEGYSSSAGIPNNEGIVQIHPKIHQIYNSGESGMWIVAETNERIITYDRERKTIIGISKQTNSIVWESEFVLSNNNIHRENDNLYFSTGEMIICMDARSGDTVWTNQTKGMIEVDIKNGILFGRKGYYAISAIDVATGNELWTYKPETTGMISELVAEDSILVFGHALISTDKTNQEKPIFYGLDLKTGHELWKYYGVGRLGASRPAIHNGIAYFNNMVDNYFYAIDISTGILIWKLYMDKRINSDITHYQDMIICYESNHDFKPCDCYIISSTGDLLKTIYLGDGQTNYKDTRIIDNKLLIPSARYEAPGDRIIVIDLNTLEISHTINLPIGPLSISSPHDGNIFFGAENGIYVMEYPNLK